MHPILPTTHAPDETAFDLRVRAELALAFEPVEPPAEYLRVSPTWLQRRGFHASVLVLLLAGVSTAGVMTVRPPELVRNAIEHEYYERTLRGQFMDSQLLLQRIGLGQAKVLPGYPQLARPCDVEGQQAYHLTTFFEKGGLVTVMAFEGAMKLPDGSGWWSNVHWRVIRSQEGKPLLLIAQKQSAIAVAQAALQGDALQTPG